MATSTQVFSEGFVMTEGLLFSLTLAGVVYLVSQIKGYYRKHEKDDIERVEKISKEIRDDVIAPMHLSLEKIIFDYADNEIIFESEGFDEIEDGNGEIVLNKKGIEYLIDKKKEKLETTDWQNSSEVIKIEERYTEIYKKKKLQKRIGKLRIFVKNSQLIALLLGIIATLSIIANWAGFIDISIVKNVWTISVAIGLGLWLMSFIVESILLDNFNKKIYS